MMIGSAMCSAYTDAMNKTGGLGLPIIAILAGCQSAPSMTSTATVQRMEGNQFMVSLDIQRDSETIASPKVLCIAGEDAIIELVNGDESLTIEVHPPPPLAKVVPCTSRSGWWTRAYRLPRSALRSLAPPPTEFQEVQLTFSPKHATLHMAEVLRTSAFGVQTARRITTIGERDGIHHSRRQGQVERRTV